MPDIAKVATLQFGPGEVLWQVEALSPIDAYIVTDMDDDAAPPGATVQRGGRGRGRGGGKKGGKGRGRGRPGGRGAATASEGGGGGGDVEDERKEEAMAAQGVRRGGRGGKGGKGKGRGKSFGRGAGRVVEVAAPDGSDDDDGGGESSGDERKEAEALPYDGDIQAAMRAQDRDAIRVLMAAQAERKPGDGDRPKAE